MPIYDYRCTTCGLKVEVSHAIGAQGPATCGSCGGTMKKALTTPAIHFKGSGWAKKDARSAAPAATTAKTVGEDGGGGNGAADGGTKPKSGSPSEATGASGAGPSDATGQAKPGPAAKNP